MRRMMTEEEYDERHRRLDDHADSWAEEECTDFWHTPTGCGLTRTLRSGPPPVYWTPTSSRVRRRLAQCRTPPMHSAQTIPSFTRMTCPLTQWPAELARRATRLAFSSGSPSRPRGCP